MSTPFTPSMDAKLLATTFILTLALHTTGMAKIAEPIEYKRLINQYANANHGLHNLHTQESIMRPMPAEAVSYMHELIENNLASIHEKQRYMGVLSHYISNFPNAVPPELWEKSVLLLLRVFREHFWNPKEINAESVSSGAFASMAQIYDRRILEMGKEWLAASPSSNLRKFVLHYERNFKIMEQENYTPSRWREIQLAPSPPLDPATLKFKEPWSMKQWLSLIALCTLPPGFFLWQRFRAKQRLSSESLISRL
jgi:hypothetical protein